MKELNIMDRNKIAEEITQCLNKHNLTFTEKMVTEYVAIWEAAKRPLIDILRNHPNLNFAITGLLL